MSVRDNQASQGGGIYALPRDTCGLDQGTDLENADAALKPLDDNGGPTKTMALRASSDAIGEGSCPGTLVQRGVDQRGLGRPSICDIGAFERDPLP